MYIHTVEDIKESDLFEHPVVEQWQKHELWIMDWLVMDLFGLWPGNTWFKVWDIRVATASIPISALKVDFGVERVTFILREL